MCVGGVFVAGALQQDSESSGMILGLRKPTHSPQPLPSSISYRGKPRQASTCWSLVRTGWGGVGWGEEALEGEARKSFREEAA